MLTSLAVLWPISAISQQIKPSITCSPGGTAKACNSLKEMVAANDIVVNYLTSDHALACFRENEDVFFLLWYDEPTEKPDSTYLTVKGDIAFRQFGAGMDDRLHGLRVRAGGQFQKATKAGGFISNLLVGSEPAGSFEDASGKLLMSDYDITLRHNMTDSDRSDHPYDLSIRRATLRFHETIANANLPPTEHAGHCTLFDHGAQQHGGLASAFSTR